MAAPSLRQLRTFVEVIERGSISLAARELDVTQPAASQQLRALERALGVHLVERASGRTLPTAAGNAMLEPARRAVAAAAEATQAVSPHRTGEAGRVRLGTGATACIHLLPPVLAELSRRMPGLELLVATGNTPELLARVENGELDAAIVTLAGGIGRSLAVRPLISDPLVALLPERPAGHNAAPGRIALNRDHGPSPGPREPVRRPEESTPSHAEHALSAAELASLPLILYERGSHTRALIEAWFRRAGRAPQPAMELGSVEAIKVLVVAGLGASLLPASALASPPRGTRLTALKPPLRRRIGIVLRHEKVIDRGLRLLLEALGRIGPGR